MTDDSCGHRKLKKQLKEFFQDIMVPYSTEHKNVTFRSCWNAGKRLFVFYRHGSYKNNKFLWPGMQVDWSESSQTPEKLHNFLQNRITRPQINKPVAAMAHLSFKAKHVGHDIADTWFKSNGIRYMANRLAANGLDEWFRHEFWKHTNFVASDFFMSNNLIQISKEVNIRRYIFKNCP